METAYYSFGFLRWILLELCETGVADEVANRILCSWTFLDIRYPPTYSHQFPIPTSHIPTNKHIICHCLRIYTSTFVEVFVEVSRRLIHLIVLVVTPGPKDSQNLKKGSHVNVPWPQSNNSRNGIQHFTEHLQPEYVVQIRNPFYPTILNSVFSTRS